MSPSLLHSTVPVLLDVLRDIPYIDFDMNLTWDGKYIALVSPISNLMKFYKRVVFT